MHIKLIRTESTDVHTLGVLLVDGKMFATTMENPWLNNEKNVSCIPTGTYKAKKFNSSKHGKTLVVEGVPNRSGILFHVGNYPKDTEGCILLGSNFSKEGTTMISDSVSAMARFKSAIMDATLFTLEVVNAC